jgi:hypothetical protein
LWQHRFSGMIQHREGAMIARAWTGNQPHAVAKRGARPATTVVSCIAPSMLTSSNACEASSRRRPMRTRYASARSGWTRSLPRPQTGADSFRCACAASGE